MTNRAIARSEAIYELLKRYKSEELLNAQISKGFIPESIKAEYEELYAKKLQETAGQVDTDYDMAIFSNYFYLNDGKVLGTEEPGSGWINPVKTRGEKDALAKIDALAGVDSIDVQGESAKARSATKATMDRGKQAEKPEATTQEPSAYEQAEAEMRQAAKIDVPTQTDIAVLSALKKSREKEKSGEENQRGNANRLYTIEESLAMYSPHISEAEVRGYVYHKQKHGVPMTGWEKFFIGSGERGKYCVANKAFNLLNQQFHQAKLVPTGAVIGVKTRFSNEYNGTIYHIVKNELNELYYASEDNFDEVSAFATATQGDLDKLVRERGICYSDGEYIPVFLFAAGNIHDIKARFYGKVNAETKEREGGDKDKITEMYGKDIADWHESLIRVAESKVTILDFSNPIKSDRPYLSKENEISSTFEINELNIDCGVSIKKHFDDLDSGKRYSSRRNYSPEDRLSLIDAFEIWLQNVVTDAMCENTTKSNILNLYIRGRGVSADMLDKGTSSSEAEKSEVFIKTFGEKKQRVVDEEKKSKSQENAEKDELKTLARIEGEKFYAEFLATALQADDLSRLNMLFNVDNNSIVPIDFARIPVAVQSNNRIFNSDFKLNDAQRDGLAFMSVNGSGCLAYGVGYGKTQVAIHNLANLLNTGQIKRPLITVPKQVYKNWINEMFGYWTDGAEKSQTQFDGSHFVNGALTGTRYKLNSWFNLLGKNEKPNKPIEDYTVTIVTYQGFETIGFSEKLNRDLADELRSVIGHKEDDDSADDKKTERQRAKEEEKTMSLIGKALQKTNLDIDVLGIDYLVIDEAHNFKNIFGKIAIPEGQSNAWRLKGGTQSARGLKAFVLSAYLQKMNPLSVNLLTATPFTNSPFELYSMFSLVAYNYLKQSNINSVFKFLSLFIETQVEYVISAKNEIELNTVIKSFKNKNILRDMLYRYFDYKDDPEKAGVKRPCKINLPTKSLPTYMSMSPTQMLAQDAVIEEANSYDPKTNRGAAGRALNWAKSNSLSPWASVIRGIEPYDDIDELIDESPKLRYTIECIKSVKDWHESRKQECSGQVIYSNRGKHLFDDFKKAIEKECGFIRKVKYGDSFVDQVEIITSSSSEADNERKELVKDAFNDGLVKVIIGTATIQEGINLQKKGTVLYILDLDWNPTAFIQLEGRIHRQGNIFKYCRIVIPMVQGTLDSFINQKLDEKSKRIATIWDKKNLSNVLDQDDYVDPMEIKFNLITDVRELVKMKYDTEVLKAKKVVFTAEDKSKGIREIGGLIDGMDRYKERVIEDFTAINEKLNLYVSSIDGYATRYTSQPLLASEAKKVKDLKDKIFSLIDMYGAFKETGDFRIASDFKSKMNRLKLEAEIKYIDVNGTQRMFVISTYDVLKISSHNLSFNDWNFNQFMGYYIQAKKRERNILKAYGLTIFDDLSELMKTFDLEVLNAKYALEHIQSEIYLTKCIEEVQAELDKRQEGIGSLEDRVEAFKSLNYLMSYPFVEKTANECAIPTKEWVEGEVVLKQELEIDEFLDVEDVSEKVTRKKLKKIQDFMNKSQLAVVRSADISEMSDAINGIYRAVNDCPALKGSEDTDQANKMCYLHYFKGNSDYFVMERDVKDLTDEDNTISQPVFGFACVGGIIEDSELGYFDINELKENNVELDFYFEPKPLREAFPAKFRDLEGERIEAERIEQERIEAERIEQERIEQENKLLSLQKRLKLVTLMVKESKGEAKKTLQKRMKLIQMMIDDND